MRFYLVCWNINSYGDELLKIALICYEDGLTYFQEYSRLRNELRSISAPCYEEADARLITSWEAKVSSLVLLTNPSFHNIVVPAIYKTYNQDKMVTLQTERARSSFIWEGQEGMLGTILTSSSCLKNKTIPLMTHRCMTMSEQKNFFRYIEKVWGETRE